MGCINLFLWKNYFCLNIKRNLPKLSVLSLCFCLELQWNKYLYPSKVKLKKKCGKIKSNAISIFSKVASSRT